MGKEPDPQLNKFSLNHSEIQVEAFTWKVPNSRRTGGLLAFSGFYKRGSAGAQDARYIKTTIDYFYSLCDVSALIIDLRKLDYIWGDDLSIWPSGWHLLSYPLRVVIPSMDENPEVHEGLRGVLIKDIVVTDIRRAFKDIRIRLTTKDPDNLYAKADAAYHVEATDEAIPLYRSAMMREEPTARHFNFLAEAEHIEKLKFLRKLNDLYEDSNAVKLEFAKHLGGKHAIIIYTELLNQDELEERNELSLRNQRFMANCKLGRNIEQQYLYEDFLYLWNAKHEERDASFRLVLLKYLLSGYGMQEQEVIPVLERLIQSQDLDAKAKSVIESKIELLKRLDDFSLSE